MDTNKQLTEMEISKASKCLKRYSYSLVMRELQIKIMMSNQFKANRLAKIRRLDHLCVGKEIGLQELYWMLWCLDSHLSPSPVVLVLLYSSVRTCISPHADIIYFHFLCHSSSNVWTAAEVH